MDVLQMTDGQLTQTIAQAQALIAQQERDKALLAALPLALAEQERRTADAIRRTEDAHARALALLAGVQRAADEWKAGLLAIFADAPPATMGGRTAVDVVFNRRVQRELAERDAPTKARIAAHVDGLVAIIAPLHSLGDRRNLPAVKIGLTEDDCGRWWDCVETYAGRLTAYF